MTSNINDIARQWANLVGAPLMWGLSSLGIFWSGARSPQEFSDMSDNLLVPAGIAFSIWLPIFAGCLVYAVIQATKTNRTREIYRKTGWWVAAGFWLVCGWSLITAFAPSQYVQWGTALIFIPAMLCLVKAMLVFARNKASLCKIERILVAAPIALIAGWTSIAVFLNWTPIAYDAMSASPIWVPSLIVLGLALLWAFINIRRSGSYRVYAFPILWGLFFLALKRGQSGDAPMILYAAVIGIAVLLAALFWRNPRAV